MLDQLRSDLDFIKRFWSYVDRPEIGCWPWLGYIGTHGYGQVSFKRERLTTHCVAYILTKGDPNKFHVCHKCDNRKCCRSDHLFLGTPLDNTQDKLSKGRMARGEQRTEAKLTNEIVLYCREQYCTREATSKELAERFNVDRSTMSLAISGKTWKHV